MALRVLLADESTTIKKALQLALTDMGVEVKSVPSGLDVVSVALDFNPDIVFADILLTKRNGYEVCADLKKHVSLRNIPVVLMWSSFMEFDEKLAEKSGCNGKLEKPFDTESLRSLIERLVPKTAKQPLKNLLDLPPLPDFVESETFIRQKHNLNKEEPARSLQPTSHSTQSSDPHEIEAVDSLDDFSDFDFQATPSQTKSQKKPGPVFDDIHLETENYGEFEEVVLVKTEKKQQELESTIKNQLNHYLENSPVALNKAQKSQAEQQKAQSLTRFEEQLMREEVRLMAEKICWQVIPEITEKIVREELKKLLNDIEKSI